MPNARARCATSWPMRPRPAMPSVLPRNSVPRNRFFSHFADFIARSAAGTDRASASISAQACSATLMLLAPGALTTRMPRLLAASTSTLSTPVPARAMIRRRGAASISRASTFVALRTSNASASATSAASASGVRPDRASISQPDSARSRSREEAGRSSATTMRIGRVGRVGRVGQVSRVGGQVATTEVAFDPPRPPGPPDLLDSVGRERADVVDDVPHLMRRHLPSEGFHASVLDPVWDDDEDFAVGRAVLPLGVDEIRGLRVQLLAHRAVAFAGIAVTAGTLLVVDLFAGGDRRRVGGDRILDRGRGRVAVGAAFGVRRRMLMLLRWICREPDRDGDGERHGCERVANDGTHRSTLLRFCKYNPPVLHIAPTHAVDRPAVVQTAKSFETPRDSGVNSACFPQSFPQSSRKSSAPDR